MSWGRQSTNLSINSQAVAWRALPTRRGDEDVGMSRKTTAAKLARAELVLKYIGKEGSMSKRELVRFVEDVTWILQRKQAQSKLCDGP